MLVVLHIGDKLREVRKRKLLTQEERAERSGIGVMIIVRIERNQVVPQNRTIWRLADALNVEPSELIACK